MSTALSRVAAALVCAGREPAAAGEALKRAGMDPTTAGNMVQGMAAIRAKPQRVLPWALIVGGVVLLCFAPLFALTGTKDEAFGSIYAAALSGVLGVGFVIIGSYRLYSGVTPWRTDELFRAWEKSNQG